MSGQRKRVAVIGGGVVGMASAWALAQRDWAVTLYEALDEVGCATSFANGAQLSYGYTDALASPAMLRQIPGLLLGLNPSFRVGLRLDHDQWLWSLRFLRQMSASAFRRNTLAGLELGLESRAALHALMERHPFDFSHAQPGKIFVHASPEGFAAARDMAALKSRHGTEQHALSAQEAIALEPALAAQAATMAGAIHAPGEEVGDPHRFCIGLAQVLAEHHDAAIRCASPVAAIDPGAHDVRVTLGGGEVESFDHVVVATGAVPAFLRDMPGLRGRIQPMKGYSFTADRRSGAPTLSVTDVARKIVFCRLGGMLRVAGLAEFGARDAVVRADRSALLVETARASLPDAADFDMASGHWAGLRPSTPDSLPIIECIAPRVTANVGHGMLGWTYSMGAGQRLAALMAKELA